MNAALVGFGLAGVLSEGAGSEAGDCQREQDNGIVSDDFVHQRQHQCTKPES